jgi:hypothetical protein
MSEYLLRSDNPIMVRDDNRGFLAEVKEWGTSSVGGVSASASKIDAVCKFSLFINRYNMPNK